MLDILILPHFSHLNMLPSNLSKICVCILTLLLAFSVFCTAIAATKCDMWINICVIKIIQFHFRVQGESLTSFFGLPFRAAFTLSILLSIIPFWSSWTLSQISHFSASRVQLLNGENGDVLIVLCLLMAVDITE